MAVIDITERLRAIRLRHKARLMSRVEAKLIEEWSAHRESRADPNWRDVQLFLEIGELV